PLSAPDGQAQLHLTRSPQCSSTLPPHAAAVSEWAFAELFDVLETRSFPATTLMAALAAQGLDRVDWLKCDTQGLDLRLYLSLPPEWRARILAVEFEPGIADVYEGEDKLVDVLVAMKAEPFWLAELEIGRTPRGRPDLLAKHLGGRAVRWVRRLAPGAPVWANAQFLRDPAKMVDALDRRGCLLGWVFASLANQPGHALALAETGARRFGGELFAAMAAASTRQMRWAMVRGIPAAVWRRLTRA
ncbi:MAG: hypothetical protein ABI222_15305, partial [Opitutaceae bacterium]